MTELSTVATALSYRVTLASSGPEVVSAKRVAAAAFLASAIVFASGSLPAAAVTHIHSDTATARHLTLASTPVATLSARADLMALAQIRDFTNLEIGWAGPNSGPLSAQAEISAAQFIEYLVSNNVDFVYPHIGLSNDGEVNFYWSRDNAVLDLGIDALGNRSLFARLDDGSEILEDEARPASPLAADLIKLIARSV